MSIYFDFKTINELTGDNNHIQPKEFTQEELSQYNGSNGRPAYVAIEGIVYDISNSKAWSRGTHFGLIAGQDLTNQFNSCHGIMNILTNAPKVGILRNDEDMSDMSNMDYTNATDNMNYMNNMNYMGDRNNMNFQYNMPIQRQVNQDTSKFTPDDWIRYITPLVTYALREPSQGMNTQNLYQKVILMGVLVGLGKTPQEAINQVRDWQNTGESQILKSGTSTGGGTGTFGGIGTAGSQGTGFGTGGIGGSTGGGTGTTGGMGTAGSQGTGFGTGGIGGSAGGGTGTTGGMGTAGSQGTGFGTGGIGGSTGGGTGTTGGMGTGGSQGTGFGTGGTGGSAGGGIGTTGGMGTGRNTRTGSSRGTRSSNNTSNRLYFN